MVKKYIIWSLPLAALYILFVALDLFAPHMTALSGAAKYASICLCWMLSIIIWRGGASPLLPAAMTATVAADTGLLFALPPAPFVSVFFAAHCLHGLRMTGAKPTATAAGCAAMIGAAAAVLTHSILMGVAAAYALMLLFNAFAAIKNGKRPGGALAACGFMLFICCDVCVALNNTAAPPRWAQVMMWVFYLPSQALIIASAVPPARL